MSGRDELRGSGLYGAAFSVNLMLVRQIRPQKIIQRALVACLGMFLYPWDAMGHCSVSCTRRRPPSPLRQSTVFLHRTAHRRIHKPAYPPEEDTEMTVSSLLCRQQYYCVSCRYQARPRNVHPRGPNIHGIHGVVRVSRKLRHSPNSPTGPMVKMEFRVLVTVPGVWFRNPPPWFSPTCQAICGHAKNTADLDMTRISV
jgi:hypothetical protein